MFVNSLFFISSTTATSESVVSEVTLNPQHPVFDGHFPGAPVTPGVVQVQAVKEILQGHLQKKLTMKTMRTCKFLEILDPGKDPSMRISIHYKLSEVIEVTASGENNGKVFFKMQASYI